MSEPKIVPIGDEFENMQAFLAHIAEDESATGFVGVVLRGDGETLAVATFNTTPAEIALAAIMLQEHVLLTMAGDDGV